eukprot:Rmarinus@m.8429
MCPEAATEPSEENDRPLIEFRPDNLSQHVAHFAIDVGGSLCKIAYYASRGAAQGQNVTGRRDGGQLHFAKFETKNINEAIQFIKQLLQREDSLEDQKVLHATGGGAHKFQDLLESELKLSVERLDEMECLITGCNFLLKEVSNEAFTFNMHRDNPVSFDEIDRDAVFPYLLVNCGSGVSIISVEGPTTYERVGGTSLGGGTYWGLCSLLTNATCFDDILELANKGDNSKVDMLVGDIFGGDYSKVGLSADTVASTFGKAVRRNKNKADFSEADIAKSLLMMCCYNITQLAYLHARIAGCRRVYFGGFFIRGQPHTMQKITTSMNFWAKGQIEAHFLRHEGYIGCLGAFLRTLQPKYFEMLSGGWEENFAYSAAADSSAPVSPTPTSPIGTPPPNIVDAEKARKPSTINEFVGALEQLGIKFQPFILLMSGYQPDVVDLHNDPEARKFWLELFTKTTDRWVARAIESQGGTANAQRRAEGFRSKFISKLGVLFNHPNAYGNLTVRLLFDLRQHCLLDFGFTDPYHDIKKRDTALALSCLKGWLDKLDSYADDERQAKLIDGVLAGNVWDYDASGVQNLLTDNSFNLDRALEKIRRPFLIGSLEKWLERLSGPIHGKIMIFVDNSGPDTVLGVLPFAREFLRRGSIVVLAANTHPTINDVTYAELVQVCEDAAHIDEVLSEGLTSGTLRVMETGTGLPCLDLRRIDARLNKEAADTDLVVLVGMGRCVHTNLHARFRCDSLKLAILKSAPLAEALGGKLFDVVCLFEEGVVERSRSCSMPQLQWQDRS